ncbi:MAG: hypothetical protein FJY85_11420 [Deltaproteobacteria bacterium]|nr:hypothetical protein [Deltaproteobacteria bacterium]
MSVVIEIISASWHVFQDAALYVISGFLMAGILRVYLPPESVARYFRTGRIRSVLNAALFGIPIPL